MPHDPRLHPLSSSVGAPARPAAAAAARAAEAAAGGRRRRQPSFNRKGLGPDTAAAARRPCRRSPPRPDQAFANNLPASPKPIVASCRRPRALLELPAFRSQRPAARSRNNGRVGTTPLISRRPARGRRRRRRRRWPRLRHPGCLEDRRRRAVAETTLAASSTTPSAAPRI